MMQNTKEELLYNVGKCIFILWVSIGLQPLYADEVVSDSNCLQHVGGGGFGDFDCYEDHTRKLDLDNRKIFNAILLVRSVVHANKTELIGYMRAQEDAAKVCDLAIKLEYPSSKERARRKGSYRTIRCHGSALP